VAADLPPSALGYGRLRSASVSCAIDEGGSSKIFANGLRSTVSEHRPMLLVESRPTPLVEHHLTLVVTRHSMLLSNKIHVKVNHFERLELPSHFCNQAKSTSRLFTRALGQCQ
jgi:hypothetical protein